MDEYSVLEVLSQRVFHISIFSCFVCQGAQMSICAIVMALTLGKNRIARINKVRKFLFIAFGLGG
jgi:hypothetical protein